MAQYILYSTSVKKDIKNRPDNYKDGSSSEDKHSVEPSRFSNTTPRKHEESCDFTVDLDDMPKLSLGLESGVPRGKERRGVRLTVAEFLCVPVKFLFVSFRRSIESCEVTYLSPL